MLNGKGYSDPGGRDTKRRLCQNLLARDRTDRAINLFVTRILAAYIYLFHILHMKLFRHILK